MNYLTAVGIVTCFIGLGLIHPGLVVLTMGLILIYAGATE